MAIFLSFKRRSCRLWIYLPETPHYFPQSGIFRIYYTVGGVNCQFLQAEIRNKNTVDVKFREAPAHRQQAKRKCHSEPVRTLAWESPKEWEISTTSLRTGCGNDNELNHNNALRFPAKIFIPGSGGYSRVYPHPGSKRNRKPAHPRRFPYRLPRYHGPRRRLPAADRADCALPARFGWF